MKTILTLIAVLFVGCKTSGEQSFLGDWISEAPASTQKISLGILKLRADGVMEYKDEMGDWEIVDGKVEARIQKTNGVIQKMFLKIEGIKKILLFKTTIVGGQYENIIEHNPPEPFYRVVE